MQNARTISISTILVAAVVAAVAGGGWYLYQQQNYVSTDNASIEAPVVPIIATGDGTLTNWDAPVGLFVHKGDSLGHISGIAGNVTVPVPASGTVIQNTAVNNEVVTPGENLGYVVNLSDLQIVANVDETSISNVTVGKTVDITVDAYPGTSFSGTVKQIGSASTMLTMGLPNTSLSSNFQKATQRVPVYITIDGTEGKNLLPGMSVEVSIHRN